MNTTNAPRGARRALALIALSLAGLGLAQTTHAAGSQAGDGPAASKHRTTERLVVRGDDIVVDRPCGAGLCVDLTDGRFRGTTGSGAYTGTLNLRVADAFDNGEDGLCAPIDGRIVLGAGTPDRLKLAVTGDSCQDGNGPVTSASFTGLARFTVVHGTGAYAGATGHGLASFLEDAGDRERMTLIGRLTMAR